jgi:hypothetical protein
VRSAVSLKGLLPGEEFEYYIDNLHIEKDENPELTITSDKILPGTTIPYQANITELTIKNATDIAATPAPSPKIAQVGQQLFFAGEKFTVYLYNLHGQLVKTTKDKSLNLYDLSKGYYIVTYVGVNGASEIKKIKL